MCRSKPRENRRGTLAPLGAILMVPILGMTAFSVDMGWISVTRSELKNAADSAAIAAAGQLIDGQVLYNLPSQIAKDAVVSAAQSSAMGYARQFAARNRAGGVLLTQLNDADVEFGVTDAARNYAPLGEWGGYPNTVRVTLRRDASANGPLGLFFARLWGIQSTDLRATSAATIYTGSEVEGFRSDTDVHSLLLPVALDVNVWNQFLWTGQSGNGKIYSGPNGAPQLQVYPCPKNAPGNFGLLCVGPPASSATAFRDWIDYGPSPDDLRYMMDHGMAPVSASEPKNWTGGPGLENTLGTNFYGISGKQRLIPLFAPISQEPYQAAGDQGGNAYYQLVGFGGATVSEVRGNGVNLEISIQPCATLDPTVLYRSTTITPAGTGSGLITTAAAPKLTQ